MQQAAIPGFRLSRSKTSVKVLTTFGLLGLVLALISACMLTATRTGLRPESVSRYYRGASDSASEIDSMLSPTAEHSFNELAEVTHLHLSGGSILLFLLCHLLSLCDLSEKFRIVMYSVSFGSFLLTFSLPWGIVYLSPVFSWLYAPSMSVLVFSLCILTVIPIREMWRGS